MNSRFLTVCVLMLAALALAGCAAGPNSLRDTPAEEGGVAGFWLGLWHGIIAPATFVISLFSKTVRLYEVHNNGGWYDFGFVLGIAMSLGGSSGGAASRRKRA